MTGRRLRGVIQAMLGQLRRTTRVDVGLAIAFAGLSYLVWSLVAGGSRGLVQTFIISAHNLQMELPTTTRAVKIFFADAGFMIDLVGLAWLAVSLTLVTLSSRQKISVSWAWVSAMCQSFVAALGAVLVGAAVYAPHAATAAADAAGTDRTLFERVSEISLPIMIALAVLIWTTFLIWLLVERARLSRSGPTLRDGLRSNVFKS